MRQYLDLCRNILEHGTEKDDRTGTGTISLFAQQMRFDLTKGFPLLTTKQMDGRRLNGIIEELLWFISGDTNMKTLLDKGVNIWNRDAYRGYVEDVGEDWAASYSQFVHAIRVAKPHHFNARNYGNLGRIYGAQWRSWVGADNQVIDQLAEAVELLKNDPDSRRNVTTAWNPTDNKESVLPPCHIMFQLYVADNRLHMSMYQRSGDVFLGVPYNIASYALLTMMLAQQAGMRVGELVITIGDAHIYKNHVEQIHEQLLRKPLALPKMLITATQSLDHYDRGDFEMEGYESHPPLEGEVSVG